MTISPVKRLIICSLMAFAAATGSQAESARRVVSANLCADELLIALADDEQIVSLSPFSADPEMSFFADQTAKFPRNRGVGEDLVRLEADLVLVGPYDNRYTRELLSAKGMEFLSLAPWGALADGKNQILDLAARLGHLDRGEALIASLDSAVASIKGLALKNGQTKTSLVLHRRGYVFHAGITGEIAEIAGLQDVSAVLGVHEAGFVRLERLITNRPDYLIVAENSMLAGDQGQALLIHPALLEAFPFEKRLVLPDKLTICGGPSTLALIDAFATEIRAKVLRY